VLGVLALTVYGPGLLFWFLIHPFARSWRRLGPGRTYLIVFSMLALLGGIVFQVRGPLLGRDLGTNWSLILVSAVLFGILAWLGAYILFVAAVPVLYTISVLEERELIDRFGETYRRYQREVPRLVPRWRKSG
jgi:hypothetical protein